MIDASDPKIVKVVETSVVCTIAAFYQRGYLDKTRTIQSYLNEAGVKDHSELDYWLRFFA